MLHLTRTFETSLAPSFFLCFGRTLTLPTSLTAVLPEHVGLRLEIDEGTEEKNGITEYTREQIKAALSRCAVQRGGKNYRSSTTFLTTMVPHHLCDTARSPLQSAEVEPHTGTAVAQLSGGSSWS